MSAIEGVGHTHGAAGRGSEVAVVPILMYHNLGRPPRGARLRKLYVRPALFAAQMLLLKIMGHRGVSMREAMPALRGETDEKLVAITFDDGYEDTLRIGLPILQRLGFTATCYVVSHCVGGEKRWDSEHVGARKPLMSVDDLRRWAAAGMEVGAHSRTHPSLPCCDDATLQSEIPGSRRDLEELLQQPVTQFCYPYGDVDDRVAHAVKAAGYDAATTTRRARARCRDDLHRLPRVMVAGHHLPPVLALQVLTAHEDRRGLRE
jgi:peptidoglycan/xylan/chitin deacetylase (PgdA/CDA1 family)